MDKPLISVIVPVYKVENFLTQCVNSIINQTYDNLEIILVDDGSPDKCPQMCDDFAKQDSRIKVIHKENAGASIARNEGIKNSNGKYIAYVDSDDWIHEKYIEELYINLTENNADISICNYSNNSSDLSNELEMPNINIYSNLEALKTIFYQKVFETAPHCKLILSNIAKKYLFPEGRVFAEDLSVIYKMLFESNKVVYTNKILYFYRDNPDGIMHKKFTPKMFGEIEAVDEMEDFVKKNCPEILPAAYSRKFSAYSQVLRWTKEAPNTPEIQEKRDYLWSFLKNYKWKMFADKNARRKNRLSVFIILLGQKAFINFKN